MNKSFKTFRNNGKKWVKDALVLEINNNEKVTHKWEHRKNEHKTRPTNSIPTIINFSGGQMKVNLGVLSL